MNDLSTNTKARSLLNRYIRYLKATAGPRIGLFAFCFAMVWAASPWVLHQFLWSVAANNAAPLYWVAIQVLTTLGCLGFVLSIPFSAPTSAQPLNQGPNA